MFSNDKLNKKVKIYFLPQHSSSTAALNESEKDRPFSVFDNITKNKIRLYQTVFVRKYNKINKMKQQTNERINNIYDFFHKNKKKVLTRRSPLIRG